MGTVIIYIIVFGLLAAFFIGCGYLLYKSTLRIKEQSNEKKKYDPIQYAVLKHIDGLPLIQGSLVDVMYCEDKFVFVKDNQEISVSLDKVIDVDNVTGKDIKAQQAQGATAGALVFGGLSGAVIGSLAATTTYFVISYKSNDEIKSIIFDCSSSFFGIKVKKHFKNNNSRGEETIEL